MRENATKIHHFLRGRKNNPIKIFVIIRVAFDEDRVPNLYDDRGVTQDIHSVSSLLKMYFRYE